jgi:2,4-dienoyl-CoA reductase-like NADH-dependent reductase (Old Yellow Enzyme family)
VPGLQQVVSLYHDQGIPVGIQIGHAGRKASAAVPLDGAAPLRDFAPGEAWQALAPSAIALNDDWPVPRALGEDEIDGLLQAFRDAAQRAVAAGFDFIEVHGAHGYLVNSFFSPLANQRDDAWGGDTPERRMRFPLAVVDAIRDSIPESMPLLYRTSVVDGVDGGVTLEDTVVLANALKVHGVDLLDCSSGGMLGPSGRAQSKPAPGYLVPYAAAIREQTGLPTMAVGLLIEAEQANDVIANGQADMVAMGRQLLEDPNFVFHAARELGHPQPYSVLPESYAFFLSRRKY